MEQENYNYEKLKVWQEGAVFAEAVYALTKNFPKEEIYGITSQLRRAALSISLNIAEGSGRKSRKEFLQFISISRGSAYEANTILFLCLRLGYITKFQHDNFRARIVHITKMLSGLASSLRD